MPGIINLFLPIFVQVLILYFLSRLINRLVLRRLGRGWYLATMWPGVTFHELSHLLACWLTFTKVFRVHLFYPSGNSLGFVEHARTRNPIKNIIISMAPLFGVTAVIWLLTKLLLPELYIAQNHAINAALADFISWQNFFSFTKDYFLQFWHNLNGLIQNFDFFSWQTYLFIYLMLALSAHAAPSKEDLAHTYGGIIGLIVLFVFFYYLNMWLQVPITWTIVRWLTGPLYFLAGFLTYGIVFAAISAILLIFVSLITRLFRKRIVA